MSTLTALITSGGGGQVTAAVPVNGIAQLNVEEDLYTDSEERVWLRNGSIITSGFSNYPDAILKNDLTSLCYSTSPDAVLSPTRSIATGFCFSEDGLNFYYFNYASAVVQYTLIDPFKINSKIGGTAIAPISNGTDSGMKISPDGTKFYMTDGTNLKYYTLSTPYDITTFTFVQNVALGASSRGFSFSDDGLKLFVAQGTTGIKEFDLVSAWNPVGLTASGNVAAAGLDTYDITWKEDGTKFYILYSSTGTAAEYNCSVPFSFAGTETSVGTKSTVANGSWGKAIFLVPDSTGKTFLVSSQDSTNSLQNTIVNWTAATAYTITTIARGATASFPAYQTATGSAYTSQPVIFNYDGTKAYASLSSGGIRLYQFSCPTPFDLATATSDSISLLASTETNVYNVVFQWTNNGRNLNMHNFGSTDSRKIKIWTASSPYSINAPSELIQNTQSSYGGVIVNDGWQTIWINNTTNPATVNICPSLTQYVANFSGTIVTDTNIITSGYNITYPFYSSDGKYLYSNNSQFLLQTPFSLNIASRITTPKMNTNIGVYDYNGYFGTFAAAGGLFKKLNYIGVFTDNVNDFVRIK